MGIFEPLSVAESVALISGLFTLSAALVGVLGVLYNSWRGAKLERERWQRDDRLRREQWERDQDSHRAEVYSRFLTGIIEIANSRTINAETLHALHHTQLLATSDVKLAATRLHALATEYVRAPHEASKPSLKKMLDDQFKTFVNAAREETGAPLLELPTEPTAPGAGRHAPSSSEPLAGNE